MMLLHSIGIFIVKYYVLNLHKIKKKEIYFNFEPSVEARVVLFSFAYCVTDSKGNEERIRFLIFYVERMYICDSFH